jgi:uncharacterized protein (TIGR03435 family)
VPPVARDATSASRFEFYRRRSRRSAVLAGLAERLQLKFHFETKELPVYALVVLNAQKLHVAEGVCDPDAEPTVPGAGNRPVAPCGGMVALLGRLIGAKMPIGLLAGILSNYTERMVLDKTGLEKRYDIDLVYTPEEAKPGRFSATLLFPRLRGWKPIAPSLFTALQEQLGLKLVSQKGPVEIMVIDHVERPFQN